ncbi:MAG: hypothetical protein L0H79_01090 [Intrasporangium sp.]|uniref:BTAD domain-containing putative transcriptional regulator n=1 Tax=Intrasporangium sp. TaxID=1925024 RepID=UPI002648C1B4|nr:BTAD domain-containing putative transcriptional regulator [Intrasporangium sp.]MDN5794329.1 hypothetical protein [Intrasporangium sp.]
MASLRFGVLGPLEVHLDGVAVRVSPGRQRAMLACLLVRVGRPVPADVLIEAAWCDDLPQDPRAAVHTVVSRLRSTLGTGVISSAAAGYALAVAADEVDAGLFEALCADAWSAPAERAAGLLREALGLWRGAAYEESADRDFAAPEAQRLERLRLDATEEHAAAVMELGRHEEAVAELEVLLARQPFREHAVELLMTTLYRAGRQADALARYRAHRELLAEELGLEPSLVLRDLESRILGHALPVGSDSRTPLAAPAWMDLSTGFFDRDRVLADLVAAVGTNRLVTVTGVGGVGKTRLVAQALPILSEQARTPITVVELARVQPGRVSTAVADALGLGVPSRAVTDDVLEYLGFARATLVLDNCEHLRDEVARFADAVGRQCPRVSLVATSRHRLGTSLERVVPLVPLPTVVRGAGVGAAAGDPAVRLFTDRVTRLRPSFALTPENVGSVVEICRRLDGLPLALELAASRAATLGVEAVLGQLDTDPSAAPLRDLRSVVGWSVGLLTGEQRRLLARLTVFARSFGFEDVVRVAAQLGSCEGERGVLGALEELAESNLLVSEFRGADVRFRMLALVRAYAAELLSASGEEGPARLAHAQWARSVAERAAYDWVSGKAAAASRRLGDAGPDLNAVLRWALEVGRLDLAAAITGAVGRCMHWLAGLELGDLAVETARRCEAAGAGPELAPGLAAGAMTSALRGDLDQTRRFAEAAFDSSQADEVGLLAGIALAVATFYTGDHEESVSRLQAVSNLAGLPAGYLAEAHVTRSLLACAHDDPSTAREEVSTALLCAETARAEAPRAFALYASGEIEAREDPERGAAQFREAAAEADRIGAAQVSQVARLALFAVLVRRDRHDEALHLVVPLLRDVLRSGTWPQVWTSLRVAAELLSERGRREDAVLLLSAADAAPSAPPLVGDDVSRYATLTAGLRAGLGSAVVDRISAVAAVVPRSRVVDRALGLLTDLDELTGGTRPDGSPAPG